MLLLGHCIKENGLTRWEIRRSNGCFDEQGKEYDYYQNFGNHFVFVYRSVMGNGDRRMALLENID